jgi:hypothetical protein
MDTAMAADRLSDEVHYDDYESNRDEKQLSIIETELEQEEDEDETQLEQEGDEDETQLEQEEDEDETQLEQEEEEDETQLEQEEDEDENQSEELLLDQPSSSGEVDPLPGPVLSLSDLYYSFWEFVARLLEFAYHPRRRCAECLQTIEGRHADITALPPSCPCYCCSTVLMR